MTQSAALMAHLASGRSITAAEAVRKYRIYRLAARVLGLRQKGYRIDSTLIRRGSKHWSEYRLAHGQRRV